jgi:hypothetical protein
VDRARLDSNIDAIRRYSAKHAELRKAHHFLYDLPLNADAGPPELVVMGINPGETPRDRCACPGPTEETSKRDFHEASPMDRSPQSKRWRTLTADFTGGRSVVFTELFFWSSKNYAELLERHKPLWNSAHLKFCIDMNRDLIEAYQPKAVIFVGLSNSGRVARAFGLSHVKTHRPSGTRLVEHFQDERRPWLFTNHWTGSRGFSEPQRKAIVHYLKRCL